MSTRQEGEYENRLRLREEEARQKEQLRKIWRRIGMFVVVMLVVVWRTRNLYRDDPEYAL